MERSIFSARQCFVELMLKKQFLHDAMYHVLQSWNDFIHEHHAIKCDMIIYVQTDPQTACSRVVNRSRSEESEISEVYIQELHLLYEKLLIKKLTTVPAPFLVLNISTLMNQILKWNKKVMKLTGCCAKRWESSINYLMLRRESCLAGRTQAKFHES